MAEEQQSQGKYTPASKFSAVLSGKCPRCRVGSIYKYNSWSFSKIGRVAEECPHCKQDLVIEPGFYWGAMYIAYAVNVAIIVTCLVVYFVLFSKYSELYLVGAIVLLIGLAIPVNYRVSKSMMVHFFSPIKFDPRYVNPENMEVEDLEVDFKKNREMDEEG